MFLFRVRDSPTVRSYHHSLKKQLQKETLMKPIKITQFWSWEEMGPALELSIQLKIQFQEPTSLHLSYSSNPNESPKNLMEAVKITTLKRPEEKWNRQGRVQIRDSTSQHLTYSSNLEKRPRNLMKSPNFRAGLNPSVKRQFQESNSLHLSYTLNTGHNLIKDSKFQYFQKWLFRRKYISVARSYQIHNVT